MSSNLGGHSEENMILVNCHNLKIELSDYDRRCDILTIAAYHLGVYMETSALADVGRSVQVQLPRHLSGVHPW